MIMSTRSSYTYVFLFLSISGVFVVRSGGKVLFTFFADVFFSESYGFDEFFNVSRFWAVKQVGLFVSIMGVKQGCFFSLFFFRFYMQFL